MDLIYMTQDKIDVGILKDYKFDLAFGSDENDFEFEIQKENHCCEAGYFLYIEGTEYGGIIDKINVDTESDTVKYKGRTWHGIIEGKVLEPDSGHDYLILDGEANAVLSSIVDMLGLSSIFTVSAEDSGIEIVNYQVNRYAKAYTTIRKMLFSVLGKLHVEYKNFNVELSCVKYTDYSQNEEWDSSQLEFEIEKNYRPVNHLICLGQGDLKDRTVIHLFTDANGGVQKYASKDIPLQDSDYIRDKSKQIMFGEDEVTDVYDYSNAGITENYVLLSDQPSNWKASYLNYYQREENSYKALESWEEDVYSIQIYQPYDWNSNYKSYFTRSGSEYKGVETYSETIQTLQTSQPSNWSTNYGDYFTKSEKNYNSVNGVTKYNYPICSEIPFDWYSNWENYYYLWSDGTTSEWKTAEGVTKYKYEQQTEKPSFWSTEYKNYFELVNIYAYMGVFKAKQKNGGYTIIERQYSKKTDVKAGSGETLLTIVKFIIGNEFQNLSSKKAPTWVAKKYYTKVSYNVAPKFIAGIYSSRTSYVAAPEWEANKYYTKTIKNVPDWSANMYYTKTKETFIPEWKPNVYYKKLLDRYAELVMGGLEKLHESFDCDSLNITLDPEQNYDVGDVVGASEHVTGISTWQQITKKIVSIEKGKTNISYKVGE